MAAQSISRSSLAAGSLAFWLAVCLLLAGLGTALLGPILPRVASEWRLTDAQAGALFFVKFTGAFLGGISVSRHLRRSLLSGTLLSAAGFWAFAAARGPLTGAAGLLLAGFGLGQIIASSNILAGRRYRSHTGSALAALNFFFALGAVLTGVLAAALLPRFGLTRPLFGFASIFGFCGVGLWLSTRSLALALDSDAAQTASLALRPLPAGFISLFAVLLFLYGGLETCLTSWLTTFALRFSDVPLFGGQSAVVLLWSALTAGRMLSSALFRSIPERTLQSAGLVATIILLGALAVSHHSLALCIECILLGLSLSPLFPAIFALLMRQQPEPRAAGLVLAVSGLGAAFFPWLVGVVSTYTGSLRVAMAVPIMLAMALLVLGRAADRTVAAERPARVTAAAS